MVWRTPCEATRSDAFLLRRRGPWLRETEVQQLLIDLPYYLRDFVAPGERRLRNLGDTDFTREQRRRSAEDLLAISPSEEAWTAHAADLIGRELVRLRASRDFHYPHGQFRDKACGDSGAGVTARSIAIQHQDDLSEMLLEKLLLPLRKGASHQRNDTREPSLMQIEAVKEPLDHDNGLAVAKGAVQIEEDM